MKRSGSGRLTAADRSRALLRGAKSRRDALAKPKVIAVALPDLLERAVRLIAERARTTPEAVVVEAVHERLSRVCEALEAGQTRHGRE